VIFGQYLTSVKAFVIVRVSSFNAQTIRNFIRKYMSSYNLSILIIALCGFIMNGCTSQITNKNTSAQPYQTPHTKLVPMPIKNIQTLSEQRKILLKRKYEVRPFTEDALYDLIIAELAGLRGKTAIFQEKYITQARLTHDPEIVARVARIALYYKNPSLLLEMAQLWMEVEPGRIEASSMYAKALLKYGRIDEAIPHIIFSLERDDTEPLLDLLVSARKLEREKLLGFYKKIEAKVPNNFVLKITKARILYEQGLSTEPLEIIDRLLLVAASKRFMDTAFELKAEILFMQGKEKEAYIATSQLSDTSLKRDLELEFADKTLERNPESGHQKLTALFKQYPNDKDITYSLACAARLLGLQEESVKLFTRVTQTPANKWHYYHAHYELGILYKKDSPVASSVHLAKFIEAANTGFIDGKENAYRLIDAIYALKEIMTTQRGVAKLRLILHDLRTGRPTFAPITYLIEAEMLREQKLLDEGYDLLSTALLEYPENQDFLYMRSTVSSLQKNIVQSEKDLRSILAINPNHAEALNALGYSMTLNSDRYSEARELILRSLKLDPKSIEALDSLGWVCYRLGDHAEAIKHLTQALSSLLIPEPEIVAHLGEVLWITGQKKEARLVWDKILQSDPNNTIIQETLERLEVE
jgi:tetratricopeptide (TPR) repeat protein